MKLHDYYTEKQKDILKNWIEEQLDKILRDKDGFIIGGCSGGVFTYEFTPTSLGMVLKVKNNVNNEVLDLTEYDMW